MGLWGSSMPQKINADNGSTNIAHELSHTWFLPSAVKRAGKAVNHCYGTIFGCWHV
jgi:hypothetical protein